MAQLFHFKQFWDLDGNFAFQNDVECVAKFSMFEDDIVLSSKG